MTRNLRNLITWLPFKAIKDINSAYVDIFLRGPELTPMDGPHLAKFLRDSNPAKSKNEQRDALLKILSHRMQILEKNHFNQEREYNDQQRDALLKILSDRMEVIKNESMDVKVSGDDAANQE